MNPLPLTIVIDQQFISQAIIWVVTFALMVLWFFSPVLMNIPKKLGLDKKDASLFIVTLGMALALPWVLTAALISIIAIAIQFISRCFYSVASKMKTKIW